MFTGIVESIGTIAEAQCGACGMCLRVTVGPVASECALGASVCVSGACLTVTDTARDTLTFDVVPETLKRSTLGAKRVGDRVNIERALRVGDRLDGHFVQGHIDGSAVVRRLQSSAREHVLWFDPEAPLRPYLVPKGSVAIDGVSLTIAAVAGHSFSIALIPTTLGQTTLSSLTGGETVNVETDIIARTVVHRLSEMETGGGLTIGSLRRAGMA